MTKNVLVEEFNNFIRSENTKKELKHIFKPILDYIFQELSIYLYFFIFFILASFFLHLGILIILIRFTKKI